MVTFDIALYVDNVDTMKITLVVRQNNKLQMESGQGSHWTIEFNNRSYVCNSP